MIKYMKKLTLLTLITGLLLTGCSIENERHSFSAEAKNVYISAKSDHYEKVEDINEKSTLIVVVEKVYDEDSVVGLNNDNLPIWGYTVGCVSVKKILKNTTGFKIDNKDVIRVIENEYYSKETNEIYHVGGYIKMKEKKKYLLFLRYSDHDGWYVPIAGTYGKVPLDANEISILREDINEVTPEEKLFNKIKIKYEHEFKTK